MPDENECPTCGTTLAPQVIVCTKCGTNVKTGEQFGTKVDKELTKKGRRKQSVIMNPTFLLAVGILVAAAFVLNFFRAKHEKKLDAAMAEVDVRISDGDKHVERKDFDGASDRYVSAKEALEAYRELAGKKKRFLARADKKLNDIVKKENQADEARREQQRRDAEARRIADLKKKGHVDFDGKLVHPTDLRKRGYLNVNGQWFHHDVLVRQYGWAYHRGKYRSPQEMNALGYDAFEGVYRDRNYVKQAQGNVMKDGEWRTWDQMLKKLPVKVTIPMSRKEYIGEIDEEDTTPETLAIRAYMMKSDPNRVKIKADEVRLMRPRRREGGGEGGHDEPHVEGPPEDERRAPIVLRKGAVVDVVKKKVKRRGFMIVHVPGRGPEASGLVRTKDVEPIMARTLRKVQWKRSMYKPQITDLSKPYRDALSKTKGSDTRALKGAADFWAKTADPEVWPNARWMEVRCYDIAKLYDSGNGHLRGKLGGLPTGVPKKTVAKKGKPTKRTSTSRKSTSSKAGAAKPAAGHFAFATKATTVRIKGGEAKVSPDQRLDVVRFGKLKKDGDVTKGWIMVEGTFGGKRTRGWIYSTQVDVTLVVRVPTADVLSGEKKVGALRQGDKVKFQGISSSGKFLKIKKGGSPSGYVTKSVFFAEEAEGK